MDGVRQNALMTMAVIVTKLLLVLLVQIRLPAFNESLSSGLQIQLKQVSASDVCTRKTGMGEI
jgi:hypothetical protein